jgi:hypothetical protein
MRTPTGLVAHVLVSVLILLSAGAIVLSLETAPPVAQTQLRGAAQNTQGASSFVVNYVETVSAPTPSSALGGKRSQSSRIRILYQAPDRIVEHVNEAGVVTTVVVVGNRRYERVGSAAWRASSLPPTAGVSVGLQVARDLLLPLQSASSAVTVTRVTNTSNTFAYLPSNLVELLDSLFGTDAAALSSVRFFATINGEFIGSQLVVGSHSPYRFAVALHFSSVNSVPPITAPVT